VAVRAADVACPQEEWMRLLITTLVLASVFSAAGHAFAGEIVFTGKTVSPNHTEIMSPHAVSDGDKAKTGGSAELAGAAVSFSGTFTGQMKIVSLLADIGQKVDANQNLLQFDYPLQGLIKERGKLSQADLLDAEYQLERVRADIASLRAVLSAAQSLRERGIASNKDVASLTRDLEVKTAKEQALAYRVQIEQGAAEGGLDSAKKKFGEKVDEHHLTGTAWIASPVEGHVLWVNPDLKPGMILTRKTKLFVVGSLDPIAVRAWLYERQVVQMRVGDKASVAFENLPGKTFEGSVTRISMSPVFSDVQLPSEYEVEITVPNPGLLLKEGARGKVTVETQTPDTP